MDKSLWQEAAKRYWTKQDSQLDDHTIQAAMDSDPDFKNYILEHKNVFEVLEYAVAEDLKHKMKSWKGQNGKVVQLSNPKRTWRTFVARAASIALIVVLAMYLWPLDRHDQAMEHYAPYKNDVERGGEKAEPTFDFYKLFMEGQQLLIEKQYNEALDKMRAVIQANPDESTLEDAEWNMLLILVNIDPKGEEYKELHMKIKRDKSHFYHDRLRRLRKWGI